MILSYDSVLPLVESPNCFDALSKNLGSSQFDDIRLYMAPMENLSILPEAAHNLLKNSNESAPFHACTFQTSVKMFLGELMGALFANHFTESVSEFVEYFHLLMFHVRTTSLWPLQFFSSCFFFKRYVMRDVKEA